MIDATGWSNAHDKADSLDAAGSVSSARAALIAGQWALTLPGGKSGGAGAEPRQMFQRMLVGWASDVLSLRAQGFDRPRHHERWRPALRPAA